MVRLYQPERKSISKHTDNDTAIIESMIRNAQYSHKKSRTRHHLLVGEEAGAGEPQSALHYAFDRTRPRIRLPDHPTRY